MDEWGGGFVFVLCVEEPIPSGWMKYWMVLDYPPLVLVTPNKEKV
jgi:hypothetical protein